MQQPVVTGPIHSIEEAYLYAALTPCSACGGQLEPRPGQPQRDPRHTTLVLEVSCRRCGFDSQIRFDARHLGSAGPASAPDSPADHAAPATIIPNDERSEVIDLAGWLTLYTLTADAIRRLSAESTADRTKIRHLRLRAGQYLDEALKFYDAESSLPPAEAFFHEASRGQYRDQPGFFMRTRLLDLRAALPVPPKRNP